MTYVSRPVRHLRDRPVPGETARLVLRVADDADVEAVADRVRTLGGDVEGGLAFDALLVAVEQEAVDDVCRVDGLGAVETARTIDATAGDAGEDVELDG